MFLRIKRMYKSVGLEHKQIVRGMLTVGAFAFAGKSVGAIKEMAIAWRYGINVTVDAYLFVFNLVQWPLLILSGVVPAVIIPLLAKAQTSGEDAQKNFRSELWGLTIVVSLGIGIVEWASLSLLIRQHWIGLEPAQYRLTTQILSWMVWIAPLGVVYVVLSSWTMAEKRHINTLLDGVPAGAVLLAVLLSKGGIMPLVLGTVVGFGAQVFMLAWYLRRKIPKPLVTFRSPLWKTIEMAFFFMLIGQTMQSSVKIADQFFAVSLGGGEITVLSYTRKIIVLIDGLFGIAIGRSILPVLAESHAHKGTAKHIARKWVFGGFILGTAVATATFLGAEEITKFLFQRGSFHYHDTLRVANALKFASLQIPFYFSAIVFRYTLFSMGKYRTYVLIAVLIMSSKLISEYTFVFLLRLGIKGIFLSDILIYVSWITGGFLAIFRNEKEAAG